MKKIILTLLLLLFSLPTLASQQTKEIVFFGDSLSDDGNLYQLLKILPKSPPYYQGRFSNGPTWAEYIGNYFYHNYFSEYSNYAYGGATAIIHNIRTDKYIAPVILPEELDSYFARSLFKDKSKSFYALWIGGNDYLFETTSDIDNITNRVVDQINWAVEKLLDKGGQGIIVINLPDLSLTPYARKHEITERLSTITIMHNAKLKKAMDHLAIKFPNKIIQIDAYTLFVELLANTSYYNKKYGANLVNFTEPCWTGTVVGLHEFAIDQLNIQQEGQQFGLNYPNSVSSMITSSPSLQNVYEIGINFDRDEKICANADEHAFWDDLHPTAVVHQILSNVIIEKLEGRG